MPRGRKVPAPDAPAETPAERSAPVAAPQPIVLAFHPNMDNFRLVDLPAFHRMRRFYNGEQGEDATMGDLEILDFLDRADPGCLERIPVLLLRVAMYRLLIAMFGAGNPETDAGN